MADQITITLTAPTTDPGNFNIYESANLNTPEASLIASNITLATMQGGYAVNISDNTRLITVKNMADQGNGCTVASSSQRLPLVQIGSYDQLVAVDVQIYESGGNYGLNSNLPVGTDSRFTHPSRSADYDYNGGLKIGVGYQARNDYGSPTNMTIKARDTNGETWCTHSANVPAGQTRTLYVGYSTSALTLSSAGYIQNYVSLIVEPYYSVCDHSSGDSW